MSGYDNSPDYGGKNISLVGTLKFIFLAIAIAVAALFVRPAFAVTPQSVPAQSSVIEIGCTGCGCRGGPGWRSNKTGKCVSEKQLRKQCGSPPSDNRCTKEN